ncbi:MAG: DUF11 domain-containing protein [Anaerolineae bacterium]|nr:DUF11 domain-containing protein [Anaerolineae bacterium]
MQTSKSVVAPRNPVGAGDGVTYSIRVTNTGTAAAHDVVVTDWLPSGVNFVEPFTWSSTDTFTNTSALTVTITSTSTITFSFTTTTGLRAGAALVITFTARISDAVGPSIAHQYNPINLLIFARRPGWRTQLHHASGDGGADDGFARAAA